jgi:hypothetical protein
VAQRVTVEMTDDIDGTEAATAPSSGVDTTPHGHAVATPFTPDTSKITK